jgi:hypothetical protein
MTQKGTETGHSETRVTPRNEVTSVTCRPEPNVGSHCAPCLTSFLFRGIPGKVAHHSPEEDLQHKEGAGAATAVTGGPADIRRPQPCLSDL